MSSDKTPPVNAKVFSDVQVGDIIYGTDSDEAFTLVDLVVVEVTAEGHVRWVLAGDASFGIHWATEGDFTGRRAAWQYIVDTELAYHTPRVAALHHIEDMIDAGTIIMLGDSIDPDSFLITIAEKFKDDASD